MKKLAIGCGVVLLVLGIAGAGVMYYVYRQVSSTVTQFAQFAQIPDLERGIRNHTTFSPPASGEITEAQLDKLIKVQTHVRQRLGESMKSLETKYKAFADKKEADLRDAPAILNAYRDLAASWMDAKRAQVDALNAADLSLDEYRWIRDRAYSALGLQYVDLDISKMVEDAKKGASSQASALRGSLGPAGPEANRKLIEKVKKLLEDNIALASFGL